MPTIYRGLKNWWCWRRKRRWNILAMKHSIPYARNESYGLIWLSGVVLLAPEIWAIIFGLFSWLYCILNFYFSLWLITVLSHGQFSRILLLPSCFQICPWIALFSPPLSLSSLRIFLNVLEDTERSSLLLQVWNNLLLSYPFSWHGLSTSPLSQLFKEIKASNLIKCWWFNHIWLFCQYGREINTSNLSWKTSYPPIFMHEQKLLSNRYRSMLNRETGICYW